MAAAAAASSASGIVFHSAAGLLHECDCACTRLVCAYLMP